MAQKGEAGLLRNHRELENRRKGSWPGTLGTRNVKLPEDLPRGLEDLVPGQYQLEQTGAGRLALLTTLGATVPPRRLKFG